MCCAKRYEFVTLVSVIKEQLQYALSTNGVLFLLRSCGSRPCFLLRCLFGASLASDWLWWVLKRLHLQEVTARILYVRELPLGQCSWILRMREWAGMHR